MGAKVLTARDWILPGERLGTVRYHVRKVADETGQTPEAILGPTKITEVVSARWEVIRRARADGHSFSAIGRALNRDHTTIINAVRRMEERHAR